jgi:hypothetical protein
MKTTTGKGTKIKRAHASKPALRLVKPDAIADQIGVARIEVKAILEMLADQGREIDAIFIHSRLHRDREELERLLADVQNSRLSALRCAVDALQACEQAACELS